MNEQVVKLIYPPALINEPVINRLIRKYNDLTVNIMRAEITTVEGWVEIQLVGQAALIEDALGWLREQGIDVQVLGA